MGETLRGVVKWFNDAKGFGFIEHSSGRDVFVHYSVIEWDGFKTLKDGEEVDYELKEGEKGLHAARVGRPNVAQKKTEDTKSVSADSENESAEPALEEAPSTATESTVSAMEVELHSDLSSTEDEHPMPGIHSSSLNNSGDKPIKIDQ